MMHKTDKFFRVIVICKLMFKTKIADVVEVWSSGRTYGNEQDFIQGLFCFSPNNRSILSLFKILDK